MSPRLRTVLTSVTVLTAGTVGLAAPATATPRGLPASAPPAIRASEPRLPAADG